MYAWNLSAERFQAKLELHSQHVTTASLFHFGSVEIVCLYSLDTGQIGSLYLSDQHLISRQMLCFHPKGRDSPRPRPVSTHLALTAPLLPSPPFRLFSANCARCLTLAGRVVFRATKRWALLVVSISLRERRLRMSRMKDDLEPMAVLRGRGVLC